MKKLSLGKIPIGVLQSTVLGMTGASSDRLLTPPRAGLDFAAIRTKGGYLIVSADPITGVSKNIGRYAMKVSANDVATSGNRPQFAESVMLLPEGSTVADIERIAGQMHEAAKESGITIVGGHTEVTPRLDRPIVVVTVFSLVKKFVTSGGAKAGDIIMMTKTAGLEGTSELVGEGAVPTGVLTRAESARARRMVDHLDVSDEADAAFRTGRVHAMHDCTEGGLVGAAYEMSLASGLGFRIDEAAVPVAPETSKVCAHLSIDPLRLIGSGSLLLAVEKGSGRRVERALRSVSRVTRIGEFRAGARTLRTRGGRDVEVKEAPEDELWRVLGRPADRRHRL